MSWADMELEVSSDGASEMLDDVWSRALSRKAGETEQLKCVLEPTGTKESVLSIIVVRFSIYL